MERLVRFTLVLTILLVTNTSRAGFVDLTKDELGLKDGNQGPSLQVDNLMISAISSIGQAGGPLAGTLYLEKGDKGLGVQTGDESGSKAISGSGPHGDEAVVIDFVQSVLASSITIRLADYKQDRDDPVIALAFASGPTVNFTDSHPNWDYATTSLGGEKVLVDVAVLLAGHGINDLVTSMYVMETSEHLYVNGIGSEVPEPSMVVLLGLGTLVFFRARKRV